MNGTIYLLSKTVKYPVLLKNERRDPGLGLIIPEGEGGLSGPIDLFLLESITIIKGH